MATLKVLQGGQKITYPVADGVTDIGRHPGCTIQLECNVVSRRHAQISMENGQYYIKDLGSGNGTIVNGKSLVSQQPYLINNRDHISFGPMQLRFACENAVAPTPTVSFDNDKDGEAGILSTVAAGGGNFGILEVRPEVKLKAVIEITRSLCGETDLNKMLPAILTTLFRVFPHADRGCILLKDEAGEMVPRAFKHRREGEDETVRLSRTILRKVLEEKAGILSADAATDSQFANAESISNLAIRSMMIVPMIDKDGEPIGVINVDTVNPMARFTGDDLDLLLTVAGQASLTFENLRLMRSFHEKQKQDSEMAIASGVQQALLPETLPEIEGWSFFASYDAAQAVGGDYYDAYDLGNDKVVLSFGDISGKGVPGAIIMSRMSSCVQSTLRFTHDPLEAVAAINNHMCAHAAEGRFVTYNFVLLDLETNEMTLVNAGHMSPMILKVDGSVDEFSEEPIGLPIGVVEDYPYEMQKRIIEPGETIVLFTRWCGRSDESSRRTLHTRTHA